MPSSPSPGRFGKALGYLPLAIEQAAAWLASTFMPAAEHLEALESETASTLERSAEKFPQSVAVTWNVTFRQLREASPAAARLLELLAFFSSEPISQHLVYSDDYRLTGDWGDDHPCTVMIEVNLGCHLRRTGQLDGACAVAAETASRLGGMLGRDHPFVLLAQVDRANVLGDAGDLAVAEQQGRDAMKRLARALGDAHPDTLVARAGLAVTLDAQGGAAHFGCLEKVGVLRFFPCPGRGMPVPWRGSGCQWAGGCRSGAWRRPRSSRTSSSMRSSRVASTQPALQSCRRPLMLPMNAVAAIR